jgi:hypothetical protein
LGYVGSSPTAITSHVHRRKEIALFGWLRTPKEPGGQPGALPRRQHTAKRPGWHAGGRPGREPSGGWGDSDTEDRNAGEDITRRRPESW